MIQPDIPNIRHLRAFCEVAHCKGISAASHRVFLSQPAITQAISKLESRLGAVLFRRMSDGMELTGPGAIFLIRAERMLAELQTGVIEALSVQNAKPASDARRIDRGLTAAQIRALVALAETRNFTFAAARIGISQPSVHRALRELERLVGVALFRAVSQGVELSAAAAMLARRARLAMAELQQGYFELEARNGPDRTRISVGVMPLVRSRILPQAMHDMLKSHSRIQICAIDGPYDELLRGLRYGETDFLIGALRDPLPAADVVQEGLFDDSLAVVVGADHPLAGREHVTVDDMLAYPWAAAPKATPAGTYLADFLGIDGLETTPVKVVSSSLVLLRGLLLRGDYITLISRQQIRHEVATGLLTCLPVTLPGNTRPIGLTFRKDWRPTPTQFRFLGHVRRVARSSDTGGRYA